MACDCDTECPGAGQCTCIGILGGSPACVCTCSNEPIMLEAMLEWDAPVTLCVRDQELAELAEFIQQTTRADILVPAAELRKRVSMKVEETSFADAIRQVGLVPAPAERADY
jgi:hypothetical protein